MASDSIRDSGIPGVMEIMAGRRAPKVRGSVAIAYNNSSVICTKCGIATLRSYFVCFNLPAYPASWIGRLCAQCFNMFVTETAHFMAISLDAVVSHLMYADQISKKLHDQLKIENTHPGPINPELDS